MLVFGGFSFLNLFLVFAGFGVAFCTWGRPLFGQVEVVDIWWWIFAFPLKAEQQFELDIPDWGRALIFWTSPLLYGLMGWFAWRMWKLMRAKPPEE